MSDTPTSSQDAAEWNNLSAEEQDFELARRLQEQEAAMYHFYEHRNGSGDMGFQEYDRLNGAPEGDIPESPSADVTVSNSRQSAQRAEEMQEADERDEENRAAGNDSPAEQIDDAEFARRLQLQEQIDQHRRIMEMAGFQDDEEDSEDEGDDEEEEADDEEEDEEAYFTDDSIDPDEMTYEELMAIGETVGVVNRGLPIEAIQQLPQARYVHPSEKQSDVKRLKGAVHIGCDTDEQCTICRMEFETKNTVKILPCGHIFHPSCVDQWLAINKVCPICGKEVGQSGSQQCEVEQQLQSREYVPKLG